ncbi:MAG: dephospho-CoA kinase [Phycisphaeraceae bacterium]|nr:dephospho-CoA kinase [Phycisphaeraceae bacterium]
MTGERILWESRASPWFVLLWRAGRWVGLAALAVALLNLTLLPQMTATLAAVAAWLFVLAFAAVVWASLVWANQTYVLTERRLIWRSGVFRRLVVEAPLQRIQNVVLFRSLRERIFGLGTLGFATAGTDGYEVVWTMVSSPQHVAALAREHLVQAGSADRSLGDPVPASARAVPEEPNWVPVVGIAGGIGSGKSEVAVAFSRLGAVVLDSDSEAKALLDDPEVSDQLVRWWGGEILGLDNRIDRSKVARIVFSDPTERRRLEEVIHPRLKAARLRRIDEVRVRRPAPSAIVIDAPLLYEAGVDAECDAVVFVDAPRALRLERVQRTRGWDEAELDRREAVQWPVAEKRRRAAYIVPNEGSVADLDRHAADVLGRLRSSHSHDRAGG